MNKYNKYSLSGIQQNEPQIFGCRKRAFTLSKEALSVIFTPQMLGLSSPQSSKASNKR